MRGKKRKEENDASSHEHQKSKMSQHLQQTRTVQNNILACACLFACMQSYHINSALVHRSGKKLKICHVFVFSMHLAQYTF
jgi:hypothetical protein